MEMREFCVETVVEKGQPQKAQSDGIGCLTCQNFSDFSQDFRSDHEDSGEFRLHINQLLFTVISHSRYVREPEIEKNESQVVLQVAVSRLNLNSSV